jgi:hypothetical protein
MAGLTPLEAELVALLRELVNIEGPQPGTGQWAEKVNAILSRVEGQLP